MAGFLVYKFVYLNTFSVFVTIWQSIPSLLNTSPSASN